MEMSGKIHAPTALTLAKNPRNPTNRRLSGPQSQSYTFQRKEKSLAFAGIRASDRPAHSILTILTTFSWVPIIDKHSNLHI